MAGKNKKQTAGMAGKMIGARKINNGNPTKTIGNKAMQVPMKTV